MKSKQKVIITKSMMLEDVVRKHPETVGIFLGHGLHCVGCHAAGFETIEQGAIAHGMKKKELDILMKELNKAVKK